MKQLVAVLLAAAVLCGPACASDAKIAADDFDGSTKVWVNPHGMNCAWSAPCYSVGARWSSKQPAAAALVIELMGAYTPIKTASLNVDGEILQLKPLDANTAYSQGIALTPGTYNAALAQAGRTSTQEFEIPLPLLQRVLAARVVKMRIELADGVVDARLVENGKASKAYGALQRFWGKLPQRPAG